MRTTIVLPDELAEKVKSDAVRDGRSMLKQLIWMVEDHYRLQSEWKQKIAILMSQEPKP